MAITLRCHPVTKFVTSEDYATDAVTESGDASVPTIPALVDYVPPPEGETWQEREREDSSKAQLPIGRYDVRRQTGPGALDPDHLAKDWPDRCRFDLTGNWAFRGENEWRPNYGVIRIQATSCNGRTKVKADPTASILPKRVQESDVDIASPRRKLLSGRHAKS